MQSASAVVSVLGSMAAAGMITLRQALPIVAYVIDQSILISDAIGNDAVKVVGEPFTVDPYGIGVTKDDPSAKQFVDAWLKTIEDDGSWADLWKATIGTVVEGDAPAPPEIGSVPGS